MGISRVARGDTLGVREGVRAKSHPLCDYGDHTPELILKLQVHVGLGFQNSIRSILRKISTIRAR